MSESVVSMKQLLESGVHFGHATRRWNPKMAKYIFTARNGIYIIDLQKTAKKIDEAYAVLKSIVDEGKTGYLAEVEDYKGLAEAMLKASKLGRIKTTYKSSSFDDFLNMLN